MSKIALFGGSFNPIHNGHISICNEILNKKIADQVWLIPVGKHAFGKKLISANHRIEMVKLATKPLKNIEVIDIEAKNRKITNTAETITKLKELYNHDFLFVIGSDNLESIDKWYNFDYLKNEVKFIVSKREGYPNENKLGIKIADVIENNHGGISSTEIRERIRNNTQISEFICKEVETYIKLNGIYKYE